MTDDRAGQRRGALGAHEATEGGSSSHDAVSTATPIDLPVWFDPDDDATPVHFLEPDEVARMCDVDDAQPEPTGEPDTPPNTGDASGAVDELLRAYLDDVADEEPRASGDVEHLLAAYLADDG
jgi:hypothetical protein